MRIPGNIPIVIDIHVEGNKSLEIPLADVMVGRGKEVSGPDVFSSFGVGFGIPGFVDRDQPEKITNQFKEAIALDINPQAPASDDHVETSLEAAEQDRPRQIPPAFGERLPSV